MTANLIGFLLGCLLVMGSVAIRVTIAATPPRDPADDI
jgi:hypothetical protein